MTAPFFLALLGPLLLLLASAFRYHGSTLRWLPVLGWGILALQALAAGWSAWTGAGQVLLPWPGWEFGIKLDGVSHVVVLTVSLVGAAVLRFSVRYLEGDPQQPVFLQRMLRVLAWVQVVALSPSLLQFAVASLLIARPLAALLLHFPQRVAARRSAWTYRWISGLGDLALGAAVVVCFWQVGSSQWTALSDAASSGRAVVWEPLALLLAVAALAKSAQFPLHIWLPDTLETPTPVSALLHAGIVNAGGLLLIRSAPVLASCPATSSVLALLGVVTAIYGAVVMLPQTSIKAALAYSTIAQMGFMILQCGLGAYSLALLHIAAHALYKAHAFLRSGEALNQPPRRAVILSPRSMAIGALFGAAVGIPLFLYVPGLQNEPGISVWLTVLLGACAYSVARHEAAHPGKGLWQGIARAFAAIALTALLHATVQQITPAVAPPQISWGILLIATLAFAGLLLFQFLLARVGNRPAWRALYVHASHGFYVQDLLKRWVPMQGKMKLSPFLN